MSMNREYLSLGRGLHLILGGIAINTLAGLLQGTAALLAAGLSCGLTALGLFLATRVDKRFWLPLVLTILNTFVLDLLYAKVTDRVQVLLLVVGQLALNAAVVCCICLFTLPVLEGRRDAGARQGQWAWKLEIAATVTYLSDFLMREVPEMALMKASLNLLAMGAMVLMTVFYLYFLWRAGSVLQKQP